LSLLVLSDGSLSAWSEAAALLFAYVYEVKQRQIIDCLAIILQVLHSCGQFVRNCVLYMKYA
jgi:hypothetical protein